MYVCMYVCTYVYIKIISCVPLQGLLALHNFKQKHPEVDLTPIIQQNTKFLKVHSYVHVIISIWAIVDT